MSEEMEELVTEKVADLLEKYEAELNERYPNIDLSFTWGSDTLVGAKETVPIAKASSSTLTNSINADETTPPHSCDLFFFMLLHEILYLVFFF